MARVIVFLKDDLLADIDSAAADFKITRSALLRSVLLRCLEARRKDREEAEIRREMEQAGKGMDALAEKLGTWNPVRIIREFRDSRLLCVGEPRRPYQAKPQRKKRP